MDPHANIYLIGPLGAGKSSIGRKLAQMTKKRFFDTDLEIAKRSGVDLNWICEVEGESGYRKREQAVIAELCQEKNIVISTGGGAVLVLENRTILKTTGTVIYLEVSFKRQYERTQLRRNTRPVLEDGNSFKHNLKKLNDERTALYEQTAHASFDTNQSNTNKLSKCIIQHLQDNP